MDAAALCDDLRRTRPMAAELARWVCLPVRISPAFVRLARLRLLPLASTGDEADLWLSDLVETRSVAGFGLRRAVREHLRDTLRRDTGALDRLWQHVHRELAHGLAPRARLEEELTWRLLRNPADPDIEALFAEVVRELGGGPNAEGVARWVTRAVPDLPDGALAHASARRAWHGAHLLLGDASALGQEPLEFVGAAELAFATRRLPRRTVWVGLMQQNLLISATRPIEGGHEVAIPVTRPLWMQVESIGPTPLSPPRVLTFNEEPLAIGNWPQALEPGLAFRLIDGSQYGLRRGTPPVSQKFMARNRAPRVQIEYDVEMYGAEKKKQLPFVVGVLADLSGKPSEALPPVAERKFRQIDVDNFDAVMKSMRPRVAFRLPNVLVGEGDLPVDITFETLDDFSPTEVARKTFALDRLLEARIRLAALAVQMDGNSDAQELVGRVLDDHSLLPALSRADSQRPEVQAHLTQMGMGTGYALILRAFAPQSHEAEAAVEDGLLVLREQVQANSSLIKDGDAARSIEAFIADIDRNVTEQLNPIIHHEDFRKLESAWRGLHYLVHHTETDEMLKIRVLNISKEELGKQLRIYVGVNWEQSPLFKKLYEEEFGTFGGEPYGCLVGDYYFDHTAPDVESLTEMAKIAAALHAPLVTGAAPSVMGMESWQELAKPRDLTKIFSTTEHAAWHALRESDDARYLALCMPRFLSRLPYGSQTNPTDDLAFEEDIEGSDDDRYCWSNAAYAMAANITRSFKQYGWCARIRGVESGGSVENLPVHSFPSDDGGVDTKCPTEIAIADRREAELSKNGFNALVHRKNSDFAAFIGAQSLHKPQEHDDPDATASAHLAARLPYLFACCRFAHYLKCIARDRIGSFKERADLERWLNGWLVQYVDADPANSSDFVKAQKPLAAAEVVIENEPGSGTGHYVGKFFLRPHYQLEGLTVSLRIVSRLPSMSR
ncbi:MAG: type VI secretion system contractile sheath large subunit [Rubrivivax sp.]|nr:type VI secretion system contractile sheath large subunit [Rubrivivax sp.]